jgi:two-component system sensor histidine kinase CiaH
MATRWTERINLFNSARLKLTLFYLGIIMLLNIMVTLSVRLYAEHEFNRANTMQRNEVRDWAVRFFEFPGRRSEVVIADIQEVQSEIVRQHLNQGLLIINLFGLGAGGLLSYWFAGRTLRPLQEAHETQARFTADASHELRTPLANMRLENEVFLRQKTFTEGDAREQISSNLEEVQRLERLSNNLLALHQYGEAALIRTSSDIEQVVDSAIDSIAAAATAKKVKIVQKVAPAKVRIHRESVVQLMDILLDNALKYGARGGEVTIIGEKRSSSYVLSVSDKGPGVSEQDLPHIFDRLYRGDKARSTKVAGYGLGLALAREIANANTASLTARNNVDGGACFELTFEIASEA